MRKGRRIQGVPVRFAPSGLLVVKAAMGDTSSTTYQTDFYAWANEQAALLRQGRLSEADIANIAEEIESMGKTEKRELVSRLTVLLAHLLKWQYQPEGRGTSWTRTIVMQRRGLRRLLQENPSIQAVLAETVADAYQDAAAAAPAVTGRPRTDFPAACPYALDQLLADEFLP